MAVFTPVSAPQAAEFLGHYTLGGLRALQGIASGIENSNFFLTTDSGEYVLTVFERLGFAQLPFYLELMQHLAQAGLPVPAPQPNRRGSLVTELARKPAAIVTRLAGTTVGDPTTAQCALVGGMLARMHMAGRDFARFQPHLRGIGWWKQTVPLLEPHVTDEVFHILAEEMITQDSFFRSALFERLPAGPIHADLFRDNVLLVDDAAGERVGGVIDFYFAGCSILLFDLAVTLNDWCIEPATGAFDGARAQALLDAYHAVRPLTEDEHAAWRTVLRAAALRFWISRLYDLHVPRRAQLLTPHDPAHFERVLQQRIAAPALPWPAATDTSA